MPSWRTGMVGAAAVLALICAAGAPGRAREQGRPLVWFAPLPRDTVVGQWLGFDGSKDFSGLFDPKAPWGNAAEGVDVFKLYGGWAANEATPAELRRIVRDLDRRGIALAVEDGALQGAGTCGQGVEGFVPPDEATRIASRIAAAGGTLRYVALDSTFRFGSLYDGPNACRYSAEEAAAQFARYAALVRRIFPGVVVGDIEALPPQTDPAELVRWMDVYRQVTGERLPFFHLDMGYRRLDWPEAARYLETAARARGIPFGMIYDGEGTQGDGGGGSDQDWTATAEQRFVTFEARYGGRPDQVVFQSWVDHPDYLLPETRPFTFTWLLRRHARPRPTLSLALRPGRVEGRLVAQSGKPVAGARVELEAMPLDGLGNEGEYDLRGAVPPGAASATVGYRIGTECDCSGPAELRIVAAQYIEAADGLNRVPHPEFEDGLDGWAASGQVAPAVEPYDHGETMLHLSVSSGQTAALESSVFPVTAGSRFWASFFARVAPLSRGSGYFSLVFRRADGSELARRRIPLAPAPVVLGVPESGKDGRFSVRVGRLPHVLVQGWFRGDTLRFPAYAAAG